MLVTYGCENNVIVKEGRSEAVSEISETKISCEDNDLTELSEKALGIFTVDNNETSNENSVSKENVKGTKEGLEETPILSKMQENKLNQNYNFDDSNATVEESSQLDDIFEITRSLISTENKALAKNIEEPLKYFTPDANVFSYEDTLLPEHTEKQLRKDFICCKNQDFTEHIEEDLSFSSVRKPEEDSTLYKSQDHTEHIEENLPFSYVRKPEDDSTLCKSQCPAEDIEEDSTLYKSQDHTEHSEEELPVSSVEVNSNFCKSQDFTQHIDEDIHMSFAKKNLNFYKNRDSTEYVDEKLYLPSADESFSNCKNQYLTGYIDDILPDSSVEEGFSPGFTELVDEGSTVKFVEGQYHIDLPLYNFPTDENGICLGKSAVTNAFDEQSCTSMSDQNIKSFDDKVNEERFEQQPFTFGVEDITASCGDIVFSDQSLEREHDVQVNENVINHEYHLVEENERQLHVSEEDKNHILNNSGVLTNEAENPMVTTGVETTSSYFKNIVFSDHNAPGETVRTIRHTVDDISGQHMFKQNDPWSVSKYKSFGKELETCSHNEETKSEGLDFALVDEDGNSNEHKIIETEHSCETKKDSTNFRDTVKTTTEEFVTYVVENIMAQAVHIAQANGNVGKRIDVTEPPNICVCDDEDVSYSCESEHLETSRCLSTGTSPDEQNTRSENELFLGLNTAEELSSISSEEKRNLLYKTKKNLPDTKEETLPSLEAEQRSLPELETFQNQQEACQTKTSNQMGLENIQEIRREMEEVLERLNRTETKLADINLMELENDELISDMYGKYMDIHQDLEKYKSLMNRVKQNISLLTDGHNISKMSNQDGELPWNANKESVLLQQKVEDVITRVTASQDTCKRLIWQLENKFEDKTNPQMIIYQDLSNARASTLDLSNETSNLLEDENQDLHYRSFRQRFSDMFWKTLPLQLFLLVGFGLASLFPKSEDQLTCAVINNYGQSMELLLHYPYGPPPV
ncbi:uncharacterized protein LOC143231086 isoform X2 [Tachypleus tridentatus]|uniref:uncharacterized protein LOC143231086 isoform X2 n=1 Tax=Tachypleus tridentatus TaxID=6853 RepID=UPI003FD677ED